MSVQVWWTYRSLGLWDIWRKYFRCASFCLVQCRSARMGFLHWGMILMGGAMHHEAAMQHDQQPRHHRHCCLRVGGTVLTLKHSCAQHGMLVSPLTLTV